MAAVGARAGARARGLDEDSGARRRHEPANDALAFVGLQAIDPRRLVGEAVPDREQQAGHDMKRALGQFGQGSDLGLPRPPKFLRACFAPMRALQGLDSDHIGMRRAQQANPRLNRAVVLHQRRRRQFDGRAARLLVDHQSRLLRGGRAGSLCARVSIVGP